jgi:glycosyltransferase involved in cell wall biosynthesis
MRVLVLSRNYPNSVTNLLGLWAQELVRASIPFSEIKVISPVPYCPPLPGIPRHYARFRNVERHRRESGVEVFYPPLITAPGYFSYRFEWRLYLAAIGRLVERLRCDFRFDLIHAHFTYPDGVVAAHLGRRYGVPVAITEHVPWSVWSGQPQVRQRAAWAVKNCASHMSVSASVLRSVEECIGKRANLRVLPNAVDGSVFALPNSGTKRIADRILFVGAVRPVKGADILLKSLEILRDRRRRVSLDIVGEPFFQRYRREDGRLRRMASDLGLEDRVTFVGKKAPAELVPYIQRSAALVLPSRIESFGVVLVEALACGTPVVSTRCGGPEDIVNEHVGVLVPPENPEALARGIEHVLDHQADYDPAELRAHALENFGLESVGRRLQKVYQDAVGSSRNESSATTVAGGIIAG